MELLRSWGYNNLVEAWNVPVATSQYSINREPDPLFLSADFDHIKDMYARACFDAQRGWRVSKPDTFVGEQCGAIIATLFAIGWTPAQILEAWSNKTLDPITLLFGNAKLKGVFQSLHRRKNGAEHKGWRLRDEIDKILQAKFKVEGRVTMKQLYELTGKTLMFTAREIYSGADTLISYRSMPDMPVADAMLASLAVQPVIQRVVFDAGHCFVARDCEYENVCPLLKTVRSAFKAYIQVPVEKAVNPLFNTVVRLVENVEQVTEKVVDKVTGK